MSLCLILQGAHSIDFLYWWQFFIKLLILNKKNSWFWVLCKENRFIWLINLVARKLRQTNTLFMEMKQLYTKGTKQGKGQSCFVQPTVMGSQPGIPKPFLETRTNPLMKVKPPWHNCLLPEPTSETFCCLAIIYSEDQPSSTQTPRG